MKQIAMALLLPAMLYPHQGNALDFRSTLSSPMVDRSIYRQGAVRRTRDTYDDWSVTCDEIVDLKQKYCSLRSVQRRDGGSPSVYLDVSTGDNGAPVALIHVPLGTSLHYGVTLTRAHDPKQAGGLPASGADGQRVEINNCGRAECLAVWSLSQMDISSLLHGQDIMVGSCSPGPAPLVFEMDLKHKSCQVKAYARISALGFSQAVDASIR